MNQIKLFSYEDWRFALYAFCYHYHSGQGSRGYRLLCRINQRWNPRNTDAFLNDIEDSEAYQYLVSNYLKTI